MKMKMEITSAAATFSASLPSTTNDTSLLYRINLVEYEKYEVHTRVY
jgi:hypothetical protein